MKRYNSFCLFLFLFSTLTVFSQNYIKPIDEKYIKSRIIDENGNEIDLIMVPGCPPPKSYTPQYAKLTSSAVMLTEVPTTTWCFGCTATSAAMTAGYYDRKGYVNMYMGPTNGGTFPLDNSSWGTTVINTETRAICPLSATMNGIDGRTTRGHVDDYWIKYGSTASDPYITNAWTQHTYADCTADFMGTSQSVFGSSDGSTWIWVDDSPYYGIGSVAQPDGGYGFKLFMQSRGYTVTSSYNQYIYGYGGNTIGFTFANYKTEINAGRPVLIHVQGHTMLGVGYDDATSTVYLHDTWDYSTHSMTWAGSYSGMQHYGVSVFQLSTTGQVPSGLTINGTTYSSGTQCKDALNTITVANASAVTISSGATVNFIAGTSIDFLPGFRAVSGSNMNASITTTQNFCTPLPPAAPLGDELAQNNEKSISANEIPVANAKIEKLVKVYPNPNNGRFILGLINFEGNTQVAIYNTLGTIVYQTIINNARTELDLSYLKKGLYFVNVKNGETTKTNKIIVQ
jgi:hypothetical protein